MQFTVWYFVINAPKMHEVLFAVALSVWLGQIMSVYVSLTAMIFVAMILNPFYQFCGINQNNAKEGFI